MIFDTAFAATIQHEWGYSNDQNDPGGETYMGISRRWYPGWAGWVIVDSAKPNTKLLTGHPELEDLVRGFYLTEVWGKLGFETVSRVSAVVACELFDSAVNIGPKKAVRFLQVGLNMLRFKNGRELYPALKPDGSLGPVTLAALEACLASADNAERLVFRCQNGEQYIYYKSNPKHTRYRGWFART